MELVGKEYRRWLKEQAKRRARIKAAYRSERSLTVVARIFGISRARVQQIVKS